MNLLQMTGLLKVKDPSSVNDIIIQESFNLNPIEAGKLVKTYSFNPGYLLYIYLYIEDYGTGLGKYITLRAQRVRKEQILAKPDLEGTPRGMYEVKAFRGRNVNPGLVEYDDEVGVYAIECDFRNGSAQIEDPYKISIIYPRKELIATWEDTTTLANYGSTVYVETYIAVKEINYKKAYNILQDFFAEAVAKGIERSVAFPLHKYQLNKT